MFELDYLLERHPLSALQELYPELASQAKATIRPRRRNGRGVNQLFEIRIVKGVVLVMQVAADRVQELGQRVEGHELLPHFAPRTDGNRHGVAS